MLFDQSSRHLTFNDIIFFIGANGIGEFLNNNMGRSHYALKGFKYRHHFLNGGSNCDTVYSHQVSTGSCHF